ncbi:MAG: hypothetical protein FWF46_01220 [Oscillospiraceae bacterium]|nr:hypothetical protein [Oscillospiraceae bacterium]
MKKLTFWIKGSIIIDVDCWHGANVHNNRGVNMSLTKVAMEVLGQQGIRWNRYRFVETESGIMAIGQPWATLLREEEETSIKEDFKAMTGLGIEFSYSINERKPPNSSHRC